MTDAPTHIPARDHAERSFVAPCTQCEACTEVRIGAPSLPLPATVSCRECGNTRAIDLAAHVHEDALDGCPLCQYHTLYIQKDVNARLGVAIIVVAFLGLLVWGIPIPQMLLALVLLAGADWLLLRTVVKRLLICYRCKAQFRGFPPGPLCRPFDLATWEAHVGDAHVGEARREPVDDSK